MEVFTKSAQDTQALGQKIGSDLILKAGDNKDALIVALYGELGSGKTTFVQGVSQALGVPHRIVSPTFIICKRYSFNKSGFRWFYHIDLYRLENVDLADLGLIEIFTNPKNLVLIEWADRLGEKLPEKSIKIYFKIISDLKRKIKIITRIMQ